jgi:hypothetical protein
MAPVDALASNRTRSFSRGWVGEKKKLATSGGFGGRMTPGRARRMRIHRGVVFEKSVPTGRIWISTVVSLVTVGGGGGGAVYSALAKPAPSVEIDLLESVP